MKESLPPYSPHFGSGSSFRMIDVSDKPTTKRRAVAQGRIQMENSTLEKIVKKQIPKGDVLALAEVAGVMAAKNVSHLLPLCHPLPLEAIRFHMEIEPRSSSVLVICEAVATAKTGVEMEALAGVSAALLSIYDLIKGVSPVLKISDILLNTKEGGKSGCWTHPEIQATQPGFTQDSKNVLVGIRAAVITLSDRCFQKSQDDGSGQLIKSTVLNWGADVIAYKILPDDVEEIQREMKKLVYDSKCELVITTGGTGVGKRDVTPEALAGLYTKKLDGVGELLRLSGSYKTLHSWLSRSSGGLIQECLIISLPGSEKAVHEGLEALEPLIPHILHVARGGGH